MNWFLKSLTWWIVQQQANYVQQIQVLQPDKPLSLPQIQPLKAVRVEPKRPKVADFHRGKL